MAKLAAENAKLKQTVEGLIDRLAITLLYLACVDQLEDIFMTKRGARVVFMVHRAQQDILNGWVEIDAGPLLDDPMLDVRTLDGYKQAADAARNIAKEIWSEK